MPFIVRPNCRLEATSPRIRELTASDGRKAMSAKRYTSMAEAIQGLKKRGFTANFEFLDQAFRHVNSGRTSNAEDLTIVEHSRFEGSSDPDDMSVIYAIESDEGTQGIIADAFGVYANPELGGFLNNVRIRENS